MKKKNVYLLLFVLIASFALITINYYTIKILSATRAYINGESEYSKGQKDALIYLYAYIETKDPAYRALFNKSLQVPEGDDMAGYGLTNNHSDEEISKCFLTGRNHPEDIPDMIWLFKTFRYTFMKTPIKIWNDAALMVNQLSTIGNDISAKIADKSLTEEEKQLAIKKISTISEDLYRKESEFSAVLGDTARKVNKYLLIANIICILFILGNIALYAALMILRLSATNQKLEVKNTEVINANKELDTLVYSVSHDLRSPITSIKGLLNIIKEENDPERWREYIVLLDNTINKQDIFILEIIEFFKNKRSTLSFHKFSLKNLIEDVIANNKFIPAAQEITVSRDITVDYIYTDELRVKMIINNLISNAIKYSDERKEVRTIFISTMQQGNDIIIEIADNGIGIDQKNIPKIFNMFFVASHANKGTGLGLYILKQNVEKLNGKVDVHSELGAGTKFTISIPVANES